MSLIRGLLKGADVHILGSAPGAKLAPSGPTGILVAVNGSFLPWPGLIPDIVLLNGDPVVSKGPGPKMTRARLRGQSVGHVLAIADADRIDAFPTLEMDWRSIEAISRDERQAECERATGLRFEANYGKRIPSSGVTALCIAANAGARSISFSGISMAGGYSYDAGAFGRNHVEVDTLALQALGFDMDDLDPASIHYLPMAHVTDAEAAPSPIAGS